MYVYIYQCNTDRDMSEMKKNKCLLQLKEKTPFSPYSQVTRCTYIYIYENML